MQIMLLIKINNLLYQLNYFRTFVLRRASRNNKILLINNNIAFTLSKKEINTLSQRRKKGTSIPATFKKLVYKDEIIYSTTKRYPIMMKLPNNAKFFLENYLNLVNSHEQYHKSIVLKRIKNGFSIRAFGISGFINNFNVLRSFSNAWSATNKKLTIYVPLVTYMLCWLQKFVFLQISFILFNFTTKTKTKFFITKRTKKNFYKKDAKIKSLRVFSSENLSTLRIKQQYTLLNYDK
jgi:hypothetical protein